MGSYSKGRRWEGDVLKIGKKRFWEIEGRETH
jgi:hypothetical protein